MSEQEDLILSALRDIQGLNAKLDELTNKTARIKTVKPSQFQRIRDLAVTPDVNDKIAKILPCLTEVKSTSDLTKVSKGAKDVVSHLEMILLSPYVEELLLALSSLTSYLKLDLLPEAKNWIRDASKDLTETMISQLAETATNMVTNTKELSFLNNQFKEWLSYKLSQLAKMKESSTSLISWIEENSSGMSNLLCLVALLGTEIEKGKEEFANVSKAVDFFRQACLKEIEEGFSTRIKDAPTFWNENKTKIKAIWQSIGARLTSLNTLVEKLSDGETGLLWRYVDAHKKIQLDDFDRLLEDLTKDVHSLVNFKKDVDSIIAHINSTKDLKSINAPFAKLVAELRQLQDELPNASSEIKFKAYSETLASISQKYGIWKQKFNEVVDEVKKETDSWKQVCFRQNLSPFLEAIDENLMEITPEIMIGNLVSVYEELLATFEKIREELGKKGDPQLLEIIIKLQATSGSVSLTDLEEALGKIKPSQTKEMILASVADLEAKKLVKVDIRV